MSGGRPLVRGRRREVAIAALLAVLVAAPTSGGAQGRPKEVECSILLFNACKNYVIEVVRVGPEGSERVQGALDTYLPADPDTLDPDAYLVLKLYEGDGLRGTRSVIWVERASGAVGGDWPSTLSNDAVRSAELEGRPGDQVELYNSRSGEPRLGLARLVVFGGKDGCRTQGNIGGANGGCVTKEGRAIAGKVSLIRIKYRAPSADPAAERAPAGAPEGEPGPETPDKGAPAPADTLPRPHVAPPPEAAPAPQPGAAPAPPPEAAPVPQDTLLGPDRGPRMGSPGG